MDRVHQVSLIVGFAIPLLSRLLTKGSWGEDVKAVLTAALAALTGLGTELAGDQVDLTSALINAVVVFTIAVGVQFGFYQPTGLSDAAQSMLIKDGEPRGRHRRS